MNKESTEGLRLTRLELEGLVSENGQRFLNYAHPVWRNSWTLMHDLTDGAYYIQSCVSSTRWAIGYVHASKVGRIVLSRGGEI